MVVSHTELIMARRQIAAMIRSDPTKLVLYRTSDVPDGAGGFIKGPSTPLVVQTVLFLPFKRRMSEFLINTELGDLPDLPYVIVGYPDLDIRRDDEFWLNGDHFSVRTVDIKQQVRVAAQVDYFGGASNG